MEDYKKKYENAIEVVKKYRGTHILLTEDVIEEMFPELMESEDERIRKDIVFYIAANHKDDGEKARWLYWLEKQGEHKPVDKVKPKFKVGDYIVSTISGIPYYITQVAYDHYLTDVGCIIMFNAQDNFELQEIANKPAWSEEDETNFRRTEYAVMKFFGGDCSLVDWLRKSLKERYTWKPSDEQIKALWEVYKGGEEQAALASLYSDLKKLMEE